MNPDRLEGRQYCSVTRGGHVLNEGKGPTEISDADGNTFSITGRIDVPFRQKVLFSLQTLVDTVAPQVRFSKPHACQMKMWMDTMRTEVGTGLNYPSRRNINEDCKACGGHIQAKIVYQRNPQT